jgi:hypothetical protein
VRWRTRTTKEVGSTMSNQLLNKPALSVMPRPSLNRKPLKAKPSDSAPIGPGHVFSRFIEHVVIRPNRSIKFPIGSSFIGVPPKGFFIQLRSKELEDNVDMKVTTAGVVPKFEYVFTLSNKSTHIVHAEIWAM